MGRHKQGFAPEAFLAGIEYPRPGYSLGFEFDVQRLLYRLRVRAPFPSPDDEWAEPKMYTMERAFTEDAAEYLTGDRSTRVSVVRDLLNALEQSVTEQWLMIDGRPYRAATTARDQTADRKHRV